MSTRREVAEQMFELFQGRRSAYAIKIMKADGGKVFIPNRDGEEDLPFTPEVLEAHLAGEIAAGIYVLDGTETMCAVVDFDGKKGDPLKDALVVKSAALTKLGLSSVLERSQSGNGVHLWFFFDTMISAKLLRFVIGSVIPEFSVTVKDRVSSYDRLFPVQNDAGDSYGSLVGLPLNGPELIAKERTVFISEDGECLPKQSELIGKLLLQRNLSGAVREIAKSLPAPQKRTSGGKNNKKMKKTAGGMKLLSQYGCSWLRGMLENPDSMDESEWHAALGQFAQIKNGEVLAHTFSSKSSKYNEKQTQAKFDVALKKDLPMRCDTIREKFGGCPEDCVCQEFGYDYPWQLAKIPLEKLQQQQTGLVYTGVELASVALDVAKEIDSGQRMGFTWGYDVLDDATELRPKDLVIVAARRSMGKTGVMIDSSYRGASIKVPQYVFSLEMSAEQLALRYLARISGVDLTLITTGKLGPAEWKRVNDAAKELSTLPIYIDDTTCMVEQMLDQAGELVFQHGQGPMWVDYLQLVKKQGRESQKEAVDAVIYAYKNIAKILDVPVVALAQFNRGEETYEGNDDLDSWLKDTGNIEQHADVIHYIRGTAAPGTVVRRWRIHKERHRPQALNFKFELEQCIFKWEPAGIWAGDAGVDADNLYELSGRGFDDIED
ncbi:MAG: hypothetical protein KOO63_08010 [Bacteroidales bacterium]|nr:hypothetical protein [Candidatus Latescibacterota bacterium]